MVPQPRHQPDHGRAVGARRPRHPRHQTSTRAGYDHAGAPRPGRDRATDTHAPGSRSPRRRSSLTVFVITAIVDADGERGHRVQLERPDRHGGHRGHHRRAPRCCPPGRGCARTSTVSDSGLSRAGSGDPLGVSSSRCSFRTSCVSPGSSFPERRPSRCTRCSVSTATDRWPSCGACARCSTQHQRRRPPTDILGCATNLRSSGGVQADALRCRHADETRQRDGSEPPTRATSITGCAGSGPCRPVPPGEHRATPRGAGWRTRAGWSAMGPART